MIIEDKFTVSAPRQQVWDFLLDIPAVSGCMPGVENVEQVDAETFKGNLVVKVGPVKANFGMEAVLIETIAPQKLTAKAHGRDKNTGSMVTATFTATLVDIGNDSTEIGHHIDVAIRGRLGQFGQGVIRETAKQITAIFIECIQARAVATASSTETVSTSSSDIEQVSQSTAMEPISQPSLIAIMWQAIVTSIRNWFRGLSGQPTD